MATLRQKSSFGPGVYRGIPFARERLQLFVEGTNRAIEAGVPVPLLKKHAPINADDKATQQFADSEGSGWIKKLGLGEDGSLEWEADNVPEEVVKAAEAGTLKFTSPEFRNHYMSEKEGVYQGPIVRHIAFTPVPGNPHQGPIETIALEELGVFQFSEADLEKKLDEPEEASQHAEDPQPLSDLPPGVTPPEEQNNPDMPPRFNNPAKMAAVLAGLAQKGVVLPSDFNFEDDAAIDILLAALNSSIKAENEAEAEKAAEVEPESPPTESAMPFEEKPAKIKPITGKLHLNDGRSPHLEAFSKHVEGHEGAFIHDTFAVPKHRLDEFKSGLGKMGMKEGEHYSFHGSSQHSETEQFSEEEILALPEKFREAYKRERDSRIAAERAAEEARQKAQQFAENEALTRNNAARERAKEGIKAAKLPPALREKLLKAYDDSEAAIQFSEGAEQPHFTASQVAELVAASLPPSLQFSEESVEEATAPKASKPMGKDATGKVVMGPSSSEQFFEQGNLPSGHVSPERAEELVRANPVLAFQGAKPWTPPSVDNFVREDNSRFPNKVMNS